MSDGISTETEVARCFAAANPVPLDHGSDTGEAHPDNSDLPTQPSTNQEDITVMELTNDVHEQEHEHTPRRWVWGLCAAAAIVAVVVGIGLVADGDDADAPADEPSTSLPATSPTLPLATDRVAVAERFVTAFNERDVATLAELAASDDGELVEYASLDGGDRAWYDAFEWRWEDVTCTSDGDLVTCAMTTRNRLTELTGVEIPTTARFTIEDGRATDLRVAENFGRYSSAASQPFSSWVASAHPTDHHRMWDDDSGASSTEVAAMFARNLDEYVAGGGPEPTVAVVLRELADGDADALVGALAPEAPVDLVWATSRSELPALATLLSAVGWDWDPRCQASESDPDGATLLCYVRPNADWVPDALLGGGNVVVRMTDDGVASLTDRGLGADVSDGLEPFWEWVRAEHPADGDAVLTERDGHTVPVLTDEAVARLATLVEEYRSTDAG